MTPVPAAQLSLRTTGTGGGTQTLVATELGEFEFDRVPVGGSTLTVNKPGSIDTATVEVDVAEGATVDTTVSLRGIGSIRGRTITAIGDPQPGLLVVSGSGYRFVIETPPEGTFFFPEVLSGDADFTLQVNSGGGVLGLQYGSASGVIVPGEELNIDVVLQPTATVRGTLVRSDGVTPAFGANLTLVSSNRVGEVADENGEFEFAGRSLRTYTLEASDALTGGRLRQGGVSLTEAGQILDLGTIVLDDTPIEVGSIDPALGTVDVAIDQDDRDHVHGSGSEFEQHDLQRCRNGDGQGRRDHAAVHEASLRRSDRAPPHPDF